VDYARRKLEANLLLWRTGENVLQIETRLPLDLAIRGAEQRRVAGPLSVHARGDSVDLGILEALTPAVNRVRGLLSVDLNVGGTWDNPEFVGGLNVRGGAMSLPGLGVRYEGLEGRARFQGNSLVLDTLALHSGGTLSVTGSVQLADFSRPELDLAFRADAFRALDVRNFLTFIGTGGLRLQGPLFGSTLSGNLTANSGVLYFADLVSKRIIDLEDPTIADLVDTTLLRSQNLSIGAKFQNRFLDSLTIQNLRVVLGSDVWLRSNEANIQLGGEVQLSKAAKTYTPSGTLDALRGSYTLHIGPITRDFTVERGSVRYFGDLNAGLDIRATHVVRAVRGEEIPVIANITGTLYAPKVTLESTFNPPISETDLVSYLVTGPRHSPGSDRDPARRVPRPGSSVAHPVSRRLAARQQDLSHAECRFLSRKPRPVQLQQPGGQPGVSLQPGMESSNQCRAQPPILPQRLRDCHHEHVSDRL
jgi:translocation and assembly module TamB